MDADQIIAALGLQAHPEGGWFAEIHRHAPPGGGRGAVTSIYYLLKAGERSHWHRIDADEIWHFHLGDALEMSLSADGRTQQSCVLGADIGAGHRPQAIVPARHWQAARSLGRFSLCGCTVAPAFEFSGFELAPKNWAPGRDQG